MNKKTRNRSFRSFLFLGFFFIAVVLGWQWLSQWRIVNEQPAAFRAALEFNGRLWSRLFNDKRLNSSLPPSAGHVPRSNGDIGLDEAIEFKGWRLLVDADDQNPNSRKLTITLADLHSLPRVESNAEFRCIEGWSEPMSFAGVRFSDFLKFYGLGIRSGKSWAVQPPLAELYPYVGLTTPDGAYYVSLDMASMLHQQTILVYEMNGQPLKPENGAPLRLLIPVKYGIKSIKRIGKIFFSSHRPPDYWAEQGYDWFSGL